MIFEHHPMLSREPPPVLSLGTPPPLACEDPLLKISSMRFLVRQSEGRTRLVNPVRLLLDTPRPHA